MSPLAFTLFLSVIVMTLVITYYSAKKNSTTSDFYTAGGGLTAGQNGLAVAGDFMSAASFLGITGAIALSGFDGFYMSVGNLIGFIFLLYFVAEPLRNLGKYTIADIYASRFPSKKVRGVAAANTLVISIFYMIAQLVGAGGLISLLLGIDYVIAVILVGVLMTIYVIFGGMTATSWVQITKAVLLLIGSTILTYFIFAKFNFSINEIFSHVSTNTHLGADFLHPGNKYENSLDMISFNLSLVLGVAGLPHLLVRFFTVKNAKTARMSVVYSTWAIGAFFLMTIFIGFGAIALVGYDAIVAANPAGNMAAPLLSEFVGGEILFAIISAIAFATILAVVSGLVLTSASAFAHDIYSQIIKKGNATEKEQMLVARIASVSVAGISVLLALVAQNLNVAFLSVLALGIGAATNLPALLLTIHWKRFNSTGMITGIAVGLISTLVLLFAGPNVWNPTPGAGILTGEPLFNMLNPTIFTVPLAFIASYIGTILSTPSTYVDPKYAEITFRSQTGYGVSSASEH